jgi:hypothetical protein
MLARNWCRICDISVAWLRQYAKVPLLVLLIPISLNLNAPIQKGHASFVRNDEYSKVGKPPYQKRGCDLIAVKVAVNLHYKP